MLYFLYPTQTNHQLMSIFKWQEDAASRAISRVETTELLAKLARTEDEKERNAIANEICLGNLKLVYSTVKAYCSKRRSIKWGSELSLDLLQVGFLGLRFAVNRYDAKFGTRLSTIAVPWIKQRIGRHIINKEQPIYIPEHLVREVHYLKANGSYSNAKKAPKNKRLIDMALYAHADPRSLDQRVSEDGSALGDLIPQHSTASTADRLDEAILKIKDLMAKANLAPRVQDVILCYASTGRISTAAKKAGVSEQTARTDIQSGIEAMQELV